MRFQSITFLGLAALVFALVVAVTPRAATSVQTSDHSIDIAGLTKAAGNLPEQAFPAH
jgi:hypothetical protein